MQNLSAMSTRQFFQHAYLGTLGDSVLGKFTRQNQADGGLDLARRNGGLLGVLSETRSLLGNTFKD